MYWWVSLSFACMLYEYPVEVKNGAPPSACMAAEAFSWWNGRKSPKASRRAAARHLGQVTPTHITVD